MNDLLPLSTERPSLWSNDDLFTPSRSSLSPRAFLEQEAIVRVLCGEAMAEDAFVRLFGPYVYSVLRRYRLAGVKRDDLFQQVFLHLWDQDKRWLRLWQRHGTGRFTSFLVLLTARLVTDSQRRRLRDSGR